MIIEFVILLNKDDYYS